jgi:lysophospholipase L1-like esterase
LRFRAAAFVLALAVGAGGCAHTPHGSASHLRYLALGDSYTIGEGAYANERWPNQLVARLREHGYDVLAPTIVAKTGWTTDELAQGITQELPHPGSYDLVTLLIGVNNQYRGRDIDEFRTQFSFLLHRAIDFAGDHPKHVIVVSIPDWGVTRFAEGRDRARIASDIDQFNDVARQEAQRAGARYADVTGISRIHGADPAFLMKDGLHPSGRAYAEWVEVVLPEAEAAMQESKEGIRE